MKQSIKRFVALCLCSSLILMGCQSQTVETFSGSGSGFGGEVVVTLEVSNGKIKDIFVVGESETSNIGEPVIDAFNSETKKKYLDQNIKDIVIEDDVVSGATITSKAIQQALNKAILAANGQVTKNKTVDDATFTAFTYGNSVVDPLEIEVTFKDNQISDIKVVNHSETPSILKTVEDYLIPRIIDSQSLAVDSITGATASSSAIKSAVSEAIDANNGNSNDWYETINEKNETMKLEGYDVIVVGLGGAGMSAYVSAAENGANVFGLDSAAKVGGTSTNVTGPMAINPKSKMDSENNGQKWLEEEDLIQDWLTYTQGDAKEEIVRLFVNESGETMDWLSADYGFSFGALRNFFHPKGWVVWAGYEGDITSMYNNAMDKAKAMNEKNDYQLELTAKKLIIEKGKVIGVEAISYDGTTYEIYGDSVILATGGFIGNRDMKHQYFGSDFNVEGMMQDNGAGILMAQEIGAATFNIDMPVMVHIAQTKKILKGDMLSANEKAVLSAFVLKSDAMIVGVDGTRFVSESGNVAFDNWKGGDTYYAIYSQEQIDSYKEKGMEIVASPMFLGQGGSVEKNTPITEMDKILKVGEDNGIVVRADSLEELATKLNTPHLLEEAHRYSTYQDGSDPLGKDGSLVHSLEKGPYYAILGAGYAYGTCGGLDIDENMNVLKTDGSVIENLYAVGQDSMGVLFTNKDAYVTYGGAAQGWVLTSGRLAGASAAEKFGE